MSINLLNAHLESHADVDLAECYIDLGCYDEAKKILSNVIEKLPLEAKPYCKLLEINAHQKNKNDFRLSVGRFVKNFGIDHPAWADVKALWSGFNKISEAAVPLDHNNIDHITARDVIEKRASNYSSSTKLQRSPVRINLLRNINPKRASANLEIKNLEIENIDITNPEIISYVTLVSEIAYKQLCRAKLEERVLNRVRELYDIANQKQLRRVRPDVLEKVEVLRCEQPNLSEVADIVISHLHAQCLLEKPAKLPPLLLVGGPGTGKTRFINKLAETLGLPFCDVPMAGSCDSFKISGLSKYWGTADAGLVATTIADSEVANPVFLFDEIDKVGHSDHGNPLDTLLLLLEEESSKRFKDDFIGLPMNLSLSSVLATANSIENLPEPLLSRFIVIKVPDLDHDGRVVMAHSVYAELLNKQGYDAMFNVSMEDHIAQKIAYLPLQGRELKRAVEASILSALGEVDLNKKSDDKICLDLHHIPDVDMKVMSSGIGFMR